MNRSVRHDSVGVHTGVHKPCLKVLSVHRENKSLLYLLFFLFFLYHLSHQTHRLSFFLKYIKWFIFFYRQKGIYNMLALVTTYYTIISFSFSVYYYYYYYIKKPVKVDFHSWSAHLKCRKNGNANGVALKKTGPRKPPMATIAFVKRNNSSRPENHSVTRRRHHRVL